MSSNPYSSRAICFAALAAVFAACADGVVAGDGATDAPRDTVHADAPVDSAVIDAAIDASPPDDVAPADDSATPACLAATEPCAAGGGACCAGLSCGTTTLGQVCCGGEGASCMTADGSDCCGALLCVNAHCHAPTSCLRATESCTGGGCCSGLTCGTTTLGQVCCGNDGAPCSTVDGSDCCGARECVNGTCQSPMPCRGATQPCTGTECCAGLSCGRTTLGQVCCGNEGASCATADGSDCCGALLCVSGHCQTPTCGHATESCSGGGCCAGLSCGNTTLGQVCCGNAGTSCSRADGADCCGSLECVNGRCGSASAGSCGYLQWWNSQITYGPYRSGLGWDTDLHCPNYTPVVLRHDSRLESAVIGNAGYMPQFVDTVTNRRFRFFHLHPQSPLATQIGHVYPAGFVVGYSGGGTADTGYPTLSSAPHLCVQTEVLYRDAFPAGVDSCH